MKALHEQEKAQFKKLFRQEKIDRFQDRLLVLETFLGTEAHMTANELMDQLPQAQPPIEIDFVRDTLRLLCQFGFARQVRFNDGRVRYEHRHLTSHHDHMICKQCGQITEFIDDNMENLQSQIAEAYGFHMLDHKMELYGICKICLDGYQGLLPLSAARPGEKAIIVDFSGGTGARIQLLQMGLRIGDVLTVVDNAGSHKITIGVANQRFIIGRGLANKVMIDRGCVGDSQPCRRLSELNEGQTAVIARVGGNGALRRRLLEMGLLKGADITVEKYAPLKDPVEVVVKGYHLTLRVEEAARIVVENVR